MNILIFNMSIINKKKDKVYKKDEDFDSIIYKGDNGVDYEGVQINEAATKYVIDLLAERNESLDKIICLSTDRVENEKIKEGSDETTAGFYSRRLYKDQDKNKLEIISLHNYFDNDENSNTKLKLKSSSEIMSEFIEIIDGLYNDDNQLNVYVDTTGGMRNDTNTLQMFVKFLSYKGIKIKLAIYSDYHSRKIETVNFYDLMEVLDGVNQFVTSGQADILSNILGKGKNEYIKKILGSMKEFSDKMMLCSLGDIDKTLVDMADNIDSFKNNYKNDDSSNEIQLIFYELIPLIQDKLSYLNRADIENKENIIRITKWCLKNNLLQQAITLYTEEIPKYILNNLIIYKGDKEDKTDAQLLYERVMDNVVDYAWVEIKKISEDYQNEKFKPRPEFYVKNKLKDIKNDKVRDLFKILLKYFKSTHNENLEMDFYEKYKIENKFTKTFGGFLNTMANNAKLYRIILGDKSVSVEKESVKDKQKKTYSKKVYTIANIADSVKAGVIKLGASVDIERVQEVLIDYLYVKIIRNQINHANENTITNDVQEYFDNHREGCILKLNDLKPDELKKYMLESMDRLVAEVE